MSTFLKIFCGLILVSVIIGMFGGNSSAPSNTAAATETPKKQGLEPYQFALMGVYGKTTERLRDPNSFELEYLGTREADGAIVGCMEFRSRNGFGGLNKGQSVWVYTGNVQTMQDAVEGKPVPRADLKAMLKASTFAIDKNSVWNKWCAGKQLTDRTAFQQQVMARMRK